MVVEPRGAHPRPRSVRPTQQELGWFCPNTRTLPDDRFYVRIIR